MDLVHSKTYHSCRTTNNILVLLFFIASVHPVFTQDNTNVFDFIGDKIESLSESMALDAVYLQTSKDIYETEENVWFKGYVLDAQYHTPSSRSRTLFVQLIEDSSNKAVWEEKYEIEDGFVNGHLYLNDSLQAGSYTLAAYSSFSFYKGARAFNAVRKLRLLKNIKSKPKLEFSKKDSVLNFTIFPEGGDLVSEIQNRVAFKAEDSKGLPVEVSGTLYENNTPIFKFKSTHAGMGSFLFIPGFKDKYHIQLNEGEKDKVYHLPQILSSGRILRLLSITQSHAVFRVSQTADLAKETLYLRLQIRGIVYSVASAESKKELIIKIPLKDIPQGIAEATLFNENLEPIAERLIYVNPDTKLNVKAILNKSQYVTREKAVLKIEVTDQNDEPVVAHLGLSVFDRLYQNKQDSKNILTHYYLSNQLKGNIYDPDYYFNDENENRHEALNLLLLTHGWRRYVWSEDYLKQNKKQTEPLVSDSISGRVRLERMNKRAKTEGQKIVMAFTSDSLADKDLIMTNSKGFFNLNNKHLEMGEKGYLYIKPMTPEKPKYVIEITDTLFDIINTNRKTISLNYPLSKKENEEETKKANYNFIVSDEVNKLEEVVLSANKKKIFRDKYLGTLDSLSKLGNGDYICRYGYLNCRNHVEDFENKAKEGQRYLAGNGTPKVYHLKKLNEKELLKKFNLKVIKGYYGKREFYQPIYDEETVNDPFPDYRNTLFWTPDLITDKNGNATVEFFTSDLNTYFEGIIESVGSGGLLGKKEFSFFVKKGEGKN